MKNRNNILILIRKYIHLFQNITKNIIYIKYVLIFWLLQYRQKEISYRKIENILKYK